MFRGSVLQIVPDLQYFSVRYPGYSLYFTYLRAVYSGYLQVRATPRTWVLPVPVYIQDAQYTCSTKLTRSNCSCDNPTPLFCQISFQMVPRGRVELRSFGVGNWSTESTGSISRGWTTNTRSISGFNTLDYWMNTPRSTRISDGGLNSELCAVHAPSARSPWSCSTTHALVIGLQYCNTPSTRSVKCTRYSEYT